MSEPVISAAARAVIGATLAQLAEGWEDLDGFSFKSGGKEYTVAPAAFAMACEALRVRLDAPGEPDDTTVIIRALLKACSGLTGDGARAVSAAVAHLHRLSAQIEMAGMLAMAMQHRSD